MGDVVAYLASQHQAMMPDAPWRHTGVTLEDFHAAVKKKSGPPKRIHVSKHGDPGSGGGSSAAAAGGVGGSGRGSSSVGMRRSSLGSSSYTAAGYSTGRVSIGGSSGGAGGICEGSGFGGGRNAVQSSRSTMSGRQRGKQPATVPSPAMVASIPAQPVFVVSSSSDSDSDSDVVGVRVRGIHFICFSADFIS